MRPRLLSIVLGLAVIGCGAPARLPLVLPVPPVPPPVVHVDPVPVTVTSSLDLVPLEITLERIRDEYVDPSRIDVHALVIGALDGMQREVAEVMVDAVRDGEVVVHVNDQHKAFGVADISSLDGVQARVEQVIRFLAANVDPGSDPAKIEYAAVNGMLATLDPHSVLFSPELARDFATEISGKFGGLGVVIDLTPDASGKRSVVVKSRIGGQTPAAKAGILPDDRIIDIDGQSTENMTVDDAMNRLRGDPGTAVSLSITRPKVPDPMRLTLHRAEIVVPSVDSSMLASHVGYLRIRQFSSGTADEVAHALGELRAQGARAWVLDLRGNTGGLLAQATRTADQLLAAGTIVTTVAGGKREETKAVAAGTDADTPVVVMIDSGTASAGEVLAGSLAHLDRAITVGTRSFGKASVQVLFDIPDGSLLKLTVEQYLVAANVSLQLAGITPDIELRPVVVPPPTDADKHPLRLAAAPGFHESDLAAHLDPAVTAATTTASDELVAYLATPDDHASAPGVAPERDFEVRFARDLVATATANTGTGLLRANRKLVARRRQHEAARIAAALAKAGAAWDRGAARPTTLTATFSTDAPGAINAGDPVAITGVVTNTGKTPAFQVHARATSEDDLFDGVELAFGKIAPGASRRVTVHVATTAAAVSRVSALTWAIDDQHGSTVAAAPLEIAIAGRPRPEFSYGYQLTDDAGNGDGLVQRGERVQLRVRVKNTGVGRAAKTTAVLRSAMADRILVSKGVVDVGALEPGESRDLDFAFETRPEHDQDDVIVELSVIDTELVEGLTEKLVFPVAPAVPITADTGRVAVGSAAVEVRSGASATAGVVARAAPGAVLTVTGRGDGWIRVETEPGRPGFVAADAVVAATGTAASGAIDLAWQSTPPRIALAEPTLRTTADHVDLAGAVDDDHRVDDLYILVANKTAKIDDRKAFYLSNRGAAQPAHLDFTATIPLAPGTNRITLVARESDDVKATRTLWIYRAP